MARGLSPCLPQRCCGATSDLFIIKSIPLYRVIEALKHALATLMVTKTEVLRLHSVREGVAPEHLTYIEPWDTICYELVRARRTAPASGSGPSPSC
jgi:hypothetical protein